MRPTIDVRTYTTKTKSLMNLNKCPVKPEIFALILNPKQSFSKTTELNNASSENYNLY